MRGIKRNNNASDLLEGVVRDHKADNITIGELKRALHERGFGFLLMIFALPLCLPIPVPPGYTTIFSIPLLFFSIQMILGMDSPWLPKWISRREMKRTTLAVMVKKGAPWLRKLEKLLRPRWAFASTQTGEKVIGVFCLIFSLSIALPLPLTNFPPAVGIVVLSLGLMAKDGFYIIIGHLIGLLGVTITALVILLGTQATVSLMDTIFK
jgi:hypothetical protein